MHDILLISYLLFLFLGNLIIVVAVFIARKNWRKDIKPYNKQTSILQLLLDPRQFVEFNSIVVVRNLSISGFIFLFISISMIFVDIYLTTLR